MMTMDEDHNVVDIFGRKQADQIRTQSILHITFLTTVKRSDENFELCLECFDLFLDVNMKSWTGALSEDKLPKPLSDLAREMGDECRPACGCKMISNEKIESICEY